MVKRVKLIVAYDGTAYHGWQLQPGADTIEGRLNAALSELLGEPIMVIGASRTDAGVHALCNVAVFDTQARMPADKISYALNRRLPEDIRIRHSEEVPADFHPRRHARQKTYEYHIRQAAFPMPVGRQYTYFTYLPLNTEDMNLAAQYLVGEHDFKSFCSIHSQAETTVRTILSLSVTGQEIPTPGVWNPGIEKEICIRVTGTGFLYHMVRIIAGTLLEVGQGKRRPEEMEEILNACDRAKAGPTAPACGLILTDYRFEEV